MATRNSVSLFELSSHRRSTLVAQTLLARRLEGAAGGASSLTIVPTACPSAIVALTGPDRFTTNVSFASTTASPINWTITVLAVSPGANVSVVNGTAV